METIAWLGIGFVSSLLLIQFADKRTSHSRINVLGYALIIAAIIYMIFAVLDFNLVWFGIEFIGVLIYGTFFYLAKRFGLLFLAIGWALHPIWDVVLHLLNVEVDFAPEWYAVMCISFDITIAAYVIIKMRPK